MTFFAATASPLTFPPDPNLGPTSVISSVSGNVTIYSTAADSTLLSSSSALPQRTSASSATATDATGSGTSQAVDSPPGKHGLDTSAAAGIGVGATLGTVAVTLFVVWILWKRRRKPRTRESDVRSGERTEGNDIEGDIKFMPSRTEKDGTGRSEAPDTSRIAEADGNSRAELEAG